MADDKQPPAKFTAQAEGEIKRARFPATSGALVTLSAKTFWELFYAATAWHQHLAQPPAVVVTLGPLDPASLDLRPGEVSPAGDVEKKKGVPCAACIGTGKNIMHGHPCESCAGTGTVGEGDPLMHVRV